VLVVTPCIRSPQMRFGIFSEHQLPRPSGAARAFAPAAAALLIAACGNGASASGTRAVPPAPVTPTGAGAAVRSTNQLAIDLLKRLDRPDANAVFSPYSIQAALAMVDTGAAGDTATQIGSVLDSHSATALARANAALSRRLAVATARPQNAVSGDLAQLNIANGLWLQSGLPLKQQFTTTLAVGFGATPQTVDFRRRPESARRSINAWVASRTAKLINDLMAPGSITVQTALVLANAIYLKARWSSPFVSSSTAPGTFVTASGAKVRAPFMTRPSTPLSYVSTRGYRAVDLPYRYSTLSMLLVLPSPGTLGRFERSLTVGSLAAVTGALKPTLVDLRMPRFHLIADTELSRTLAALGMPVAFSDRADFSGITAQTPLAISAVEHGADLKVDEAGTVAAAATGIALAPTAVAPGQITQLSLDHPFLLFLRDDQSGAILFAGRVSDPTQG
jgi:serpin B